MNKQTLKSICVFCGSRFGNTEIFKNEAKNLGTLLAENDIRLVFGGGCVGLMGETANAALQNGGKVLGIIPEILLEKEIPHDKVTELIVVKTLHKRKELMAKNSDAFIILPGGIGTMEEFFEVFTWQYLNIHTKPIYLLNINHFYDAILQLLDQMVASGFMEQKTKDRLVICESVDELFVDILKLETAS